MWFHEVMDAVYTQGLRPAIADAGYDPLRIDQKKHNDKIDDEIVAEIRRSGLLVADFTGDRGGVYYEAGLAVGLGIPVIRTCRKDHLPQLHLDTRQFLHLVWETPEELYTLLFDHIRATVPRH